MRGWRRQSLLAGLAALLLYGCGHLGQPDASAPASRAGVSEFDTFARPSTLSEVRRQHPQLRLPLPATSPGAALRQPFFTELMDNPLDVAERAADIEAGLRTHAHSARQLFQLKTHLGGIELSRSAAQLAALDRKLQASATPLDDVLAALGARPAATNPALPAAFSQQLARLLAVLEQAERFRVRAFARLPANLTAELLLRQAVDGQLAAFEEPDFRRLLEKIETPALAAGMLDLLGAVEDFVAAVRSQPLPALHWQADSPHGRILIDSRAQDHHHDASAMLLLIDGAGDDHYHFGARAENSRQRVIIDLAGNDHYQSSVPASGPAAGVLGYDILWDVSGDDVYDSREVAANQAAALFGAAALIDEAGNDRYLARSHAQAWALGGSALLLDRAGDDVYHALAFAQAAAGPAAVASLVDIDGNDRYQLAASPLILPSAQLPARNLSLGQGAASGIRAEFSDGRSLPGGLALFADLAGDDHYQAQVFAQGAGYYEGSGLFIDGGGSDRFEAAWYAMGAAAHRAIGLFSKRGVAADHYRASHSTALGAAHDLSLAYFSDDGGDDHFELGDLGFGSAHDNGVAIFTAGPGRHHYQVNSARCRAFGAALLSSPSRRRARLPALGFFFDAGEHSAPELICPSADTRTRPPQP